MLRSNSARDTGFIFTKNIISPVEFLHEHEEKHEIMEEMSNLVVQGIYYITCTLHKSYSIDVFNQISSPKYKTSKRIPGLI